MPNELLVGCYVFTCSVSGRPEMSRGSCLVYDNNDGGDDGHVVSLLNIDISILVHISTMGNIHV